MPPEKTKEEITKDVASGIQTATSEFERIQKEAQPILTREQVVVSPKTADKAISTATDTVARISPPLSRVIRP